MIETIRSHHDVIILGLRTPGDEATIAAQLRPLLRREVAVPAPPDSRASRLRHAARQVTGDPLAPWERELLDAATSAGADCVMTIGPWLDIEYRALYSSLPSIHLAEEDITVMPEIAPQSAQARLLRRFEDIARRRAGMTPGTVVVISSAEIRAADRRFPQASVECLPYTLDPEEWPTSDSASTGSGVLVVGNLTESRNSEGLVEVLGEIERRGLEDELPVDLVSAAGIDQALLPFTSKGWVRHLPPVAHVSALYRQAAVAIVPSTRATGFKTTVLQAWTKGCPVVCGPSTARTLGPGTSAAVLVGNDAVEMVDHLLALSLDKGRREQLASSGLRLARGRFAREREHHSLLRLIDQARSTRT